MTKSEITLALSKIRDWGGMRKSASLLSGATPRHGQAILQTGSVTVPARWVTTQSVIVVTPQTQGSSGNELFVNHALTVPGVSFKISSSDAADGRTIMWLAVQEPIGVPDQV